MAYLNLCSITPHVMFVAQVEVNRSVHKERSHSNLKLTQEFVSDQKEVHNRTIQILLHIDPKNSQSQKKKQGPKLQNFVFADDLMTLSWKNNQVRLLSDNRSENTYL